MWLICINNCLNMLNKDFWIKLNYFLCKVQLVHHDTTVHMTSTTDKPLLGDSGVHLRWCFRRLCRCIIPHQTSVAQLLSWLRRSKWRSPSGSDSFSIFRLELMMDARRAESKKTNRYLFTLRIYNTDLLQCNFTDYYLVHWRFLVKQ